jgi:hypothetical protein
MCVCRGGGGRRGHVCDLVEPCIHYINISDVYVYNSLDIFSYICALSFLPTRRWNSGAGWWRLCRRRRNTGAWNS